VRRTTVALAHPLYGDVLRDTMSALQSRALQRRLADAFASQDAIADADVVRLVGWRLDLGEPVAIDYLTRAARRALGASDFELAERFARVAAEQRASPADRTLLGIALAGQGRIDEAHGVLAATAELSDPESQAAVLSRALDVFFFGSKTGSAAEAVRRVEQVLSDARGWPSDREPLVDAARAGVQLLAGTVRDSRNTADRVLVNAAAPQVAQLRALLVAAPSAAMAGRTNEALVHVERGLEIVRGGTAGTSTATDELVDVDAQALLTSTISFAKHLAGQLDEAASIARDGYRDAVQAHSHAAKGVWAFACGQVLYSEGRVRTATRMLREAATLLRNPPSILFTWCLGSLAQSASLSGDVKIAKDALAEANDLRSQSFRVFDCELARGDAWCTAQSGDRIAGSEIARRAAEIAEERGQAAFAALAAHDAARLGATRPAARQLARLASECDGDFIPLLARHATAAADGAASLLDTASKDFEALGAQLLAAEAAADAVRAYDAQGRPERARATANRARALASECEHARTPALASLPDGFNLSSREEEVARLAADGLSNRDIAARLHVSVRTVDNHLHRTYIKLGVDGRDQLRELLRPET